MNPPENTDSGTTGIERHATMDETMEKTILVVDDQDDIRTFVCKALESRGYKTLAACDGEEGWAMVQKEKPDLLILDVKMPKMTGIEVLANVRAAEALREIPVIMLTGETGDEDVLAGLTGGADHYLTKPITLPILLSTIRMVLGEE